MKSSDEIEILTSMVNDNDELVKDALYEKYGYIVEIILKKYNHTIYGLKIDYKEIKQEALLAFSTAITTYNLNEKCSLPTYIALVVERKLLNYIRHSTTSKNYQEKTHIRFELENENSQNYLNKIGDLKYEPLTRLENTEKYQDLINKIKESLSPFEEEVYNLILNEFTYMEITKILNKEAKQIDNSIQRIRNKIKEIIKDL